MTIESHSQGLWNMVLMVVIPIHLTVISALEKKNLTQVTFEKPITVTDRTVIISSMAIGG